jgi:hypothetical protein
MLAFLFEKPPVEIVDKALQVASKSDMPAKYRQTIFSTENPM